MDMYGTERLLICAVLWLGQILPRIKEEASAWFLSAGRVACKDYEFRCKSNVRFFAWRRFFMANYVAARVTILFSKHEKCLQFSPCVLPTTGLVFSMHSSYYREWEDHYYAEAFKSWFSPCIIVICRDHVALIMLCICLMLHFELIKSLFIGGKGHPSPNNQGKKNCTQVQIFKL